MNLRALLNPADAHDPNFGRCRTGASCGAYVGPDELICVNCHVRQAMPTLADTELHINDEEKK